MFLHIDTHTHILLHYHMFLHIDTHTHISDYIITYMQHTHRGKSSIFGVWNSLPLRLKCHRRTTLTTSRNTSAAANPTTHVTTVPDSSKSGFSCIARHVACLRELDPRVGITWKLVHPRLLFCESMYTCMHQRFACIAKHVASFRALDRRVRIKSNIYSGIHTYTQMLWALTKKEEHCMSYTHSIIHTCTVVHIHTDWQRHKSTVCLVPSWCHTYTYSGIHTHRLTKT
jgi:hypothetical protein